MNYHISRDGQQNGSFPESEVRSRLQSGEFRPTDLCWTEGMSEWQPIGQVLTNAPAAQALNPYAPPLADISTPSKSRANVATLGQRLGASILDVVVTLVFGIPFFIGAGMAENLESDPGAEMTTAALSFMGGGGVLLLLLMIYTIFLLSTQGQTLGKNMLGIRIVNNQDDSQAGFVRAFLLRIFVNGIIGVIPLYGLVDICFIFGQERRCIHDLLAGTRVIQG